MHLVGFTIEIYYDAQFYEGHSLVFKVPAHNLWRCDRFFSECFHFLLSVSLHQCSVLIFVSMLFVLRR